MSDYEIFLLPSAQRLLRRLPEKVATAVAEFLYGTLAANPRRVGKELGLDYAGLWSARRGEYRVLYRIDEDIRRIEVEVIEHRADVYRPGRS